MSKTILIIAEKSYFSLTDPLTRELAATGIELKHAASLNQAASFLTDHSPELVIGGSGLISKFKIQFSQIIKSHPNSLFLEMPNQIQDLPRTLTSQQFKFLSAFLYVAFILPNEKFSKEKLAEKLSEMTKRIFLPPTQHMAAHSGESSAAEGGKEMRKGRESGSTLPSGTAAASKKPVVVSPPIGNPVPNPIKGLGSETHEEGHLMRHWSLKRWSVLTIAIIILYTPLWWINSWPRAAEIARDWFLIGLIPPGYAMYRFIRDVFRV